jgi:flagellin
MLSIQTNVSSLIAQQNLNINNEFQANTIQQLTSGYRINSSGDDAAGLAVANKYRNSVAELTQGVANGNDGVAQLQIMDGGMSNISQILDRLKTLATQSASGTLSGGDTTRATLNSEFQTDLGEIDRQAQSIGLNTNGAFATNLSVYLGEGSGSASLANGQVVLDLSKSAVDSQALGMKGMQSVNSNVSLGPTSASSVQNIVSNSGNAEATSGYALLQFSGAGFSDAGTAQVSVNLAGVTDMGSLVTAVNNAIQATGEGKTAAASAFAGANIVASVYTDENGGQELAFTSSTAAFQVQAGDQMGNALLGNVVGGNTAQGIAVTGTSATTVTGAATQSGNFSAAQPVKLVVSGGGLASPVTLTLNDSAQTSTTNAIIDLETQFANNSQLQAAGMSMTGSSVVGNSLSFNSASGQAFNIQVTGDTQNLLGLGSFLSGTGGTSSYTSLTAGSAYSATALTGGSGSVQGAAAGLEVSINGQASTALTPIDLTTGASATAASLTGSIVGATTNNPNGVSAVDVTAANNNLNITVTNNGVADNQIFSLATTAQVATAGSSQATMQSTYFNSGQLIVSAAANNNQFNVSYDGGAVHTVSIANGTYTAKDAFLGAVNNALATAYGGTSPFTATWGTTGTDTGLLTITNNATGSQSSIALSQALYSSSGSVAGTLSESTGFSSPLVVSAANHNNQFNVSVDGGATQLVTLTAGSATYTSAAAFMTAFTNALANATGGAVAATASWGPTGTGDLTLTSNSQGANSSVAVSAVTYGSQAAVVAGTSPLTNTSFGGSGLAVTANNNHFSIAQDGGAAQTITVAAGTYTSAAQFLTALNGAGSLNSTVTGQTASFGALGGGGVGALTITSTTGNSGAGSTVTIGQVNYSTAATLSGTVAKGSYPTSTTSGVNDSFQVSVNGATAVTVALGTATFTSADQFIGALSSAVSSATGGAVSAAWGTAGTDTGNLSLISTSTGSAASVGVSAVTTSTRAALSGSTLLNSDSSFTSGLAVTSSNDTFDISLDGGPAEAVSIADTTYTSSGQFLTALNAALVTTTGTTPPKIEASWGALDGSGTGALTFTSRSGSSATGLASYVAVSADGANTGVALIGYSGGASAEGAVVANTGLTTIGINAGAVGHGASGVDGGMAALGFTNGQEASGVNNALTNGGLAAIGLNGASPTQGSATAADSLFSTLGMSATLGRGQDDVPTTLQSIAQQIQTQFGAYATVSLTNTNRLVIASATNGANSSVTINAPATHSANTLLGLSGTASGTNSSLTDIVNNLNAQFAANAIYQKAGLKAAATNSGNTGPGNYLTVSSNNGTQFRLNALGGSATQTNAVAASSTVTQSNIAGSPVAVTQGTNDQFNIAVDGGTAVTVTLGASTGYATANALKTALQNAINQTSLNGQVTVGWGGAGTNGGLTLTDASANTGTASTLTLSEGNGAMADLGFTAGTSTGAQAAENLGFGVAGSTFVGQAPSSTGTTMSTQLANGVSNTTAVDFNALNYGTDKQALTFSAMDANGVLETKTITLENNTLTNTSNTAGANIDSAVAYINQQLQASTNMPALQQIVAVTQANSGGTAEQINFVSNLSAFTVGIGASANGTDGLNGGAATQLKSTQNNSAATMSIASEASALQAITAITNAVSALGSAQAAVGKGENQLNYAVNLAQSQITNFSAAESQIRDADVAAQAANLSKAQVLQQSTIAAMAQANSAPQAVLSLLKG